MLGRDHALLGAAAYLGGAPLISHAFHCSSLSPTELAVGAAVCAGFALLPDIDEPGSTVSRKLGPLSEAVAHVTNKLAGGHRHATHSLLFVAVIWFLTGYSLHSELAVGLVVFCSLALSLRMILPMGMGRGGIIPLALIVGATYWAIHSSYVGAWLPWACAAGVLLHLVGDALTVEGVPFLWVPLVRPLQNLYIRLPLLGHTSSVRESLLGSALGLLIILFLFANVFVPESHEVSTNARTVHVAVPSATSISSKVHLSAIHAPTAHQAHSFFDDLFRIFD